MHSRDTVDVVHDKVKKRIDAVGSPALFVGEFMPEVDIP